LATRRGMRHYANLVVLASDFPRLPSAEKPSAVIEEL